jgi:hypothetical protein
VTLISYVIPVTQALHIPTYIIFTSLTRMLSFFSYFPTFASSATQDSTQIPRLTPIDLQSLPCFNSFEGLEAESLEALNGGKVIQDLALGQTNDHQVLLFFFNYYYYF